MVERGGDIIWANGALDVVKVPVAVGLWEEKRAGFEDVCFRHEAWCLLHRAGFVVDTMWFLKSDSERCTVGFVVVGCG